MNKKSESLEFKCHKCGSNKLACIKRMKCITPVEIISNGNLNYDPAIIIDTGDCSNNTEKFCCKECETLLVHYNGFVKTEKELWGYLEYCTDTYFQPGSAKEHTFDLMARVEEDGFITLRPEKDK